MVDAARPADDPDPLPAGARQEMLLPEARQRHLRPARQARPDQGEGRRRRGLSLLRRHPRACSPACRWGRSNSTAGAAGSTRSNSPTGWCSTSTPTSASTSRKVKEAAVRLRDLLADLGLKSFPMLTGGKGIHVVVPLDAVGRLGRGQELRRALRRAIAEAEPERSPPTSARPSARAASSSTGCATSAARPRSCLIPPAPAKARRSPRRSPGKSSTSIKGGNAFTIRDADQLLERAGSKALAGWGQAKQALPDA